MDTLTLSPADVAIVFLMGSLCGMAMYRALSLLCSWADRRAKQKALDRWRDISPYRAFTHWAE